MYATIGAEAGTNEGEGAQQLRRIYSVRMRIYANVGTHIRKCVGEGVLWWGAGALTCRRKYVGADTYIC